MPRKRHVARTKEAAALRIYVEVYGSLESYENGDEPFVEFSFLYSNDQERRVFGQQCGNAFLAGQVVFTYSSQSLVE